MPAKHRNSQKLEAALAAERLSTAEAAERFGVHRSTVYRWKKAKPRVLEANPSKFFAPRGEDKARYVYFPEMETILLEAVLEASRKGNVTTKSVIAMIARIDADFVASRSDAALRAWISRFLKRNRNAMISALKAQEEQP